MLNLNANKIVEDISTALINCGEDFLVMKNSVDRLYELFESITGINFYNLSDGDIFLPSGKAISPSGAAHCLLEMKRTAIFIRGIKRAIDSKICNKKIRILYAGCGPYATLITPILHYYSDDKLKVTILDINEVSLAAAEKLIKELDLVNFIGQFVLADAATYKINESYDIVISETMQSGLKNEPQVAIMQNLIPQCNLDTLFIPEEIAIEVYLRKRGIWNGDRLLEEGGEEIRLCELFAVNKNNLDSSSYQKIVSIPHLQGPYDLFLYTFIKVFHNEVLGLNDCSLNLPLKYFEIRDNCPTSLKFWYNQSNKPKIESKVLDYIA
jgi:predicted RNA methylase